MSHIHKYIYKYNIHTQYFRSPKLHNVWILKWIKLMLVCSRCRLKLIVRYVSQSVSVTCHKRLSNAPYLTGRTLHTAEAPNCVTPNTATAATAQLMWHLIMRLTSFCSWSSIAYQFSVLFSFQIIIFSQHNIMNNLKLSTLDM